MKAQSIDRTKKGGLLRIGGWGLCLLAGLLVLALAGRHGVREGLAQTPPQQQRTAAQDAANRAQTPAPDPKTTPENDATVLDERKKQIADESASLLRLANTLKVEVDKTTKDTLSVTVVRKAGEIEQLAHKMRTK